MTDRLASVDPVKVLGIHQGRQAMTTGCIPTAFLVLGVFVLLLMGPVVVL